MAAMNVFTPGYLAQMYQRSPSEIEGELCEAGFRPALLINNLCYWPEDVLPFLRDKSRRLERIQNGIKTANPKEGIEK